MWDTVAQEVGVISTVDYDEGFEGYVYGVRFPDGSEWASTDVVLLAAAPPEGDAGGEPEGRAGGTA